MTKGVEGLGHDAKKALGASHFTLRIYRAVVEAGRPVTAKEIHDAIKDDINYTDTSLWWQRRMSPYNGGSRDSFDVRTAGQQRVKERVRKLASQGVLISDGVGRGREAHYTPGRAPKGFRYKEPPYGWYEIDFTKRDAKIDRYTATMRWQERARTELERKRPTATALRDLVVEARALLKGAVSE